MDIPKENDAKGITNDLIKEITPETINSLSSIKISKEKKDEEVIKISSLDRNDHPITDEKPKSTSDRVYKETPIEFGLPKEAQEKVTEKERIAYAVTDMTSQQMMREFMRKYKNDDNAQPRYYKTAGCRLNLKSVFATKEETGKNLIPNCEQVMPLRSSGINLGIKNKNGGYYKVPDLIYKKRFSNVQARLQESVKIPNREIVKEQVGINIFDLSKPTIFDVKDPIKQEVINNIREHKGQIKFDQEEINENTLTNEIHKKNIKFEDLPRIGRKRMRIRDFLKKGQLEESSDLFNTKNNIEPQREANAGHVQQENIFNTVLQL